MSKNNDWIDIAKFHPENDLPCEYVIEITCKGWFRPNEEEPTNFDDFARFAADERHLPVAKIVKWRRWETGEPWEKGQKLVREYRNQIAEKSNEAKPNMDD